MTQFEKSPRDPSPPDAPAVDISVVVITFNRAAMLEDTLASLVDLDTTAPGGGRFSYEVVVVNNASTDDTQQVIDRYAGVEGPGSVSRVRSFYETEPGVAPARNRGMDEAAGEWIAFHDDDQTAEHGWLLNLLALAVRKNLKVAGGAVRLSLPESNTRTLSPQCRALLGERVGWNQEQPYTRKRIPGTNNLLLHRSVIDQVGGFDKSLKVGGTDADLYRRIRCAGYEAWYTPDAVVNHVIPEKRLSDDYMRWTATRNGMHLALREYREWGRAKLAGMFVIRFAQAGINFLPRFAAAKLFRGREEALGARALLWRYQGYAKRAWELLRQGDGGEEGQRSSLDFRKGREQLMQGAASDS